LKKEEFNKKLKTLFSKVGVKTLDINSKDVFSYNNKVDYTVLFKKRLSIVFCIFVASFLLQLTAMISHFLTPDPKHFMTTFNGHIYEIAEPRSTIEEAVWVNKQIDGTKKILRSDYEENK
jgi:hypothetical protein